MPAINPSIKTDSDALPVDVREVKIHIRHKNADDDELLPHIYAAARQLEDDLGRSFINKVWTWKLDTFVGRRDILDDFWFQSMPRNTTRRGGTTIQIPRPPLQSVDSITYIDQSGATQTLAASKYQVDAHHQPGRIAPSASAVTWPSDVGDVDYLNAVTIEFTAGYGTNWESIPYRIRHAIAMLTAHYYENRETTMFGMPLKEVHPGTWDQVASYQIQRF